MSFTHFSKNGRILPITDAVIPLSNIAYQYGFGVYETLKVRNAVVYFIKQHIQRLLLSAGIIKIQHAFSYETVHTYLTDFIRATSAGNQSFNVKILMIGGENEREAEIYILPLAPLYPDRKLYSKGASVETVQYERYMPNAKSLNMTQSYIHYATAKRKKQYDMLFVDKAGHILEGTRTNFFVISQNKLVTPPKKHILEGVTRQTVIAVAHSNDFEVLEQDIPLSALGEFDCAFLTSTSSNIIPVVQINNFHYKGIPDRLKTLMRLYERFLRLSGGEFSD